MPSSFERFIVENAEAEISRLLFSRIEWPSPPADSILSSFDGKELAISTIEARQKLTRYQPFTLAQASRISGVSPADISVLLVYFGR